MAAPSVDVMLPSTRVDLRKRGHLTDLEVAVLDFERGWWKYAGAKDTAIREAFGHTSVRHYQLLSALINRPEALAHDPLLVRRLLRLRSERQRQWSARRLDLDA